MKKILCLNKKGEAGFTTGLIAEIILVVALIPSIGLFVYSFSVSTPTPSTSEIVLMGLTTLFITLGLIMLVAKKTGLMKK